MADQRELLRYWEASWRKHGWEPVVLTPREARANPLFSKLDQIVKTYPTRNPRAYEEACYHRWLALQHAGGGWMTDYDVMNYGFNWQSRAYDFEIPEISYVPCVAWTTASGAARAVELIMSYGKPKWPAQADHVSDMLIFQNRLINGKDLGDPANGAVVREFGDSDWLRFSLTHFAAGATHRAGYKTKVAAILGCGRPL